MSFSEWKEVKLGDVAGYVTEKIEITEINLENYVSTENLIADIGGLDTASGLPNVSKVNKFEKNDILISNIRPYFKKIWLATQNGGCSNDVLVLKAGHKVDSTYLYYNLACYEFFNYVMSAAKGTKMPRGDKKHILDYSIYLPEFQEQKSISNILSTLDEKIEVNNVINKTLEEMAQAIFKQWFVDFEFPNEDGEPYKSSGGEMIESELGMIPKGWEVGSVCDLGDIIGGATPSKKKEEYFTECGIPWITPKDLSENKNIFISRGTLDITEEAYKSASVRKMPKGTVLFSSRAPIGYIAISKNEVTTNQGFKSIVPAEIKGFSSEFIYCWLKQNLETIENRASGSTFKEISGSEMKKIPAIIPNEDILDKFKSVQRDSFRVIEIKESETETLKNLRDTLLPKLMSGEIRVPLND